MKYVTGHLCYVIIVVTIHLLFGRLLTLWPAFLLSFYFTFIFLFLIVPEEEVRAAEEKFEESKEICYNSMLNLIETSDVSWKLFLSQYEFT